MIANKRGKPAGKIRRGDSAAHIYEHIRSRILSMILPPGAAIDEAAIVREFRVSRTPVREAIVRLASDGLVILLPNKGSQVTPLDLTRIRDYLEAMDLVQPFVTALAARRRSNAALAEIEAAAAAFEKAAQQEDGESMVMRNRDFHSAIARCCGNELLAAAYHRLLDEGLRIARFTLYENFYPTIETHSDFVNIVIAEHRQMLEAITAHDVETAEHVAILHTDRARSRFSAFLGEGASRKRSQPGA